MSRVGTVATKGTTTMNAINFNDFAKSVAEVFATTTTKEKPVKTTTKKARTHTIKPVAVEAPAVAEIVEAPVDIVAVTASAVAEVINYDGAVENAKLALRSACIASSVAVDAGVSLRTLEAESKVAGKKIGKSTFSRYAKVGAQLIVDPSLDADELLNKVYKAEVKARKQAEKAKASKASAETEGAESDTDSTEAVVALTVAEIVERLTDGGAVAIADIVANLVASLQDDHEVFVTLAVALLDASANTAPLEATELKSTLQACATTVAIRISLGTN
jgi:hypothetical protein